MWKTAALAGMFLTLVTTGWGETRQTHLSGEHWSFHTVDVVTLNLEDGTPEEFNEVCLAEGVVPLDEGAASLKFFMLSASTADDRKELRGYTWVQITGGIYDFGDTIAVASIHGINTFLGAKNAVYEDSILSFAIPDMERFRDFMIAAESEEFLYVRDYRGKPILRFSTIGLPDVRTLLWQCAGV